MVTFKFLGFLLVSTDGLEGCLPEPQKTVVYLEWSLKPCFKYFWDLASGFTVTPLASVLTLRPHLLNGDLALIFILKFHSPLKVLLRQEGLCLSFPTPLLNGTWSLRTLILSFFLSCCSLWWTAESRESRHHFLPWNFLTQSPRALEHASLSTFLHMSAAKLPWHTTSVLFSLLPRTCSPCSLTPCSDPLVSGCCLLLVGTNLSFC